MSVAVVWIRVFIRVYVVCGRVCMYTTACACLFVRFASFVCLFCFSLVQCASIEMSSKTLAPSLVDLFVVYASSCS